MSSISRSPDHVLPDRSSTALVVVWAFRRSTNRLVPGSR